MNRFEVLDKNNQRLKPERKTKYSAAYDLKASIKEPIGIMPNETAIIPTGVTVQLNQDKFLDVRIRSGHAFKHQLTLQNDAGIIDADYYPNEINCAIRNEGKHPFVVMPDMRIAQALLMPYYLMDNDEGVQIERKGGAGHTGDF